MEVRDIVQAIFGAVVLKPDEALLASALNNSVIFSQLFGPGGPSETFLTVLGFAHVLILILGLGLLIGVGPVASAAIALLVVLGVAGGLFAVGQIMDLIGPQFAGAAQSANAAIGSVVVQPYFADLFVVAPLLVLAAGALRWQYAAKRKRRRSVVDAQEAMKQHCSFCGARLRAAASKCSTCGKTAPAKAENFCGECGKRVGKDAAYCQYCGAVVLRGEDAKCPSCGGGVSARAVYCFHCGQRIQTLRQ